MKGNKTDQDWFKLSQGYFVHAQKRAWTISLKWDVRI